MSINKKDKYLICKYCGTIFAANKRLGSNGYTLYNMKAKFCSRSCSAKSNKTSHTKESILGRISMCFNYYQKYCPKEVILDYIGVSSKTLVKFNITILEVNTLHGYSNNNNYFENQVFNYLCGKYSKYTIIREHTFYDLIYKSKLRIDFYIPELLLAVEADGSQHWDVSHPYYSKEGVIRDSIKTEYLKSNNINLIRVPYKRKLSKKYFDSLFNQSLL